MDKILVKLFVPALGKSFDVFIPNFLKIKTVCELLGSAVMDLSNLEYVSSGYEVLCSFEKNQILGSDQILANYEVNNGDTLIFC